MDFLDELEAMAQTAIHHPDDEPHQDDVQRWQMLFGYSRKEAVLQLKAKRSYLGRPSISEQQWAVIREDKEEQWYDKEAYEHSQWLFQQNNTSSVQRQHQMAPKAKPAVYLLKLDGPLANISTVRTAAMLSGAESLVPLNATDEDGEAATFCKVNAAMKHNILRYLAEADSAYQPTFIRYTRAAKDLDPCSAYPTLGIDPTLPQHRPNSELDVTLRPTQEEYPVWYFFYGKLGDPSVLKRLLGLVEEPVYHAAKVRGGALGMWADTYMALRDATGGNEVVGQAYLVEDEEKEDALRCYETDKYEVVRCDINLPTETVRGLTFRFTE